MSKKLPLAFATLALSCTVTANASNESSLYLGAQYSAQELTLLPNRDFQTAGIIAGYQYNQFFSLEARFNTGISGYSSHPFSENGFSDAEYKEDIDSQASLFLKASYPIFNSFNIYALAGMTQSKYEITTISSFTDIEGITTDTYPSLIKLSESGFSYGLGLNYQMTSAFIVFFDYKILPDLMGSSWKSASFGASYSF